MDPIVARAQELNANIELRDTILSVPASRRRDLFLRATLMPSATDVIWLLGEKRLEDGTVKLFIIDLLQNADDEQRNSLFRHNPIGEILLAELPLEAADILRWAVLKFNFPPTLHVATILRLLPLNEGKQRTELAMKALDRCLPDHFSMDEVAITSMLLGVVGQALDADWAVHRGLDKG